MERRGEGFGRRGGGVALQVQVRHKNSPFPLLCASWASIVPTLISSREEVFLQDRRRHSAAASWLICSRVLKPLLLFLQNKNCLNYSPVQCSTGQQGVWGLARRHQHGHSRVRKCSHEERKLWWCCCGSSASCEYWSAIHWQRWKRSCW